MARRRRMLLGMAIAAAVAALAGVAALSVPSARAYLKRSPVVMRLNSSGARQLDSWIYNATHPVVAPSALGDGHPPSEIRLADPMGLARDSAGTLYIGDRGMLGPGHVIWSVSGGTGRVIAGTGKRGVARTGIPALESELGYPQSIALDARGRVHIADSYNQVVLRIEPDGRLTRVAGRGRPGSRGDGGPATAAELNQPYDVRFDSAGNLYIADFGNHRVRKVTPNGVIYTVAGTGQAGYRGDGGPAVSAQLNGPYGVCPHPTQGLLIADSGNNVIRVIDAEGRIRTIAGTGEQGRSGDGGPAAAAKFDSPQGLAVDPVGRIFVGDEHNHAIRLIDTTGTVRHVAGAGLAGYSADGTAAGLARLNDPENMVALSDGSLLFTEAGNHRLRGLGPAGQLFTLAGVGR